jgi:hypothetical protein
MACIIKHNWKELWPAMKSRSRVHTPAVTPTGAAAAGAALIVVAAFLGLIALIAGSAPLYADWIVTRQGERFEIRGTWQLKGKLVVFTLPSGTLSSMRADRVDLDASKQATALAKKQAEAPPAAAVPAEPKRRAVIVLTDKDFKKAAPPESAAPGAPSGAGKDSPADSPAAKSAPSNVEVVAWERAPTSESKANGTELTGTVRNTSQDILTEVGVVAALFDDSGGLIGRFPAVVDRQQLPPAETSKFHLVANGVFAFAAIRWETTGKGFKSVQPAPAPPPR